MNVCLTTINVNEFKNTLVYIISEYPQLILPRSKPDGNGTFVNFLIVTESSYIETRFKNVNNNLGKNEKYTGLNFAGSVMQGKSINNFYHNFEYRINII